MKTFKIAFILGTSYDLRAYAISNGDFIDEKIQKRYTVRLGVQLVHNFNCEAELNFSKNIPESFQSSLPRLRMKLLSPKARKLIKQTSLIMQRENSHKSNLEKGQVSSEIEVESRVSLQLCIDFSLIS
jgi:hypothetical protein